jgi:hypothetical protein
MAPRRDPKDKAPSRRAGDGAGGGRNKRGGSGTDSRSIPSDGGAKGFEPGNSAERSSASPRSADAPKVQAKFFAPPGAPTPKSAAKSSKDPAAGQRRPGKRAIPDVVANRMARRSAIASGFPTLMGMAVFVASYLLVSREIVEIPPSATLVASGGCFLIGLVGLSYGVFSSSWEEQPGSLLGSEQIRVNLSRLRESIRSMRQAG